MSLSLDEGLQLASYAQLWRIARHYRVAIGHDCRRAALLARLRRFHLHEVLADELALLHESQAAALHVLASAGGSFPRREFERLFGSCTLRRSAHPGEGGAAALAARALLVVTPSRVLLPDEVRTLLPPGTAPPLTWAAHPYLLYDLGILLGATLRDDGGTSSRTPRLLAQVAARCYEPAPEAYVRWLCDCATAAGLLERQGATYRAVPAPLARWLAMSEAAQLRQLWSAWLDAAPAAADRRPGRLHCGRCPDLCGVLVRSVVAAAQGTASTSPPGGEVQHTVADLLCLWSGLTCVKAGACSAAGGAETVAERAARALSAAALEVLPWCGLCSGDVDSSGARYVLRLSARGREVFLQQAPAAVPPVWRFEIGAHGTAPETAGLAVPAGIPVQHILDLARIAAPLPGGGGVWELDPLRLARCVADGMSVAGLWTYIETLAGRPAPEAWRRVAAGMLPRTQSTLRPVLLLEHPSALPDTQPPLSTLVARTLSPRAAVVHPRRVRALQRALAAAGSGLAVEVEGPEEHRAWPLSRAHRLAAAVGLGLIAFLAERGLPVPQLPAPREAALLAHDEDEAAAIRLALERLLAALEIEPLLPAEDRPGADAGQGGPVPAETQARLRAAIAAGHAVYLQYARPDGSLPHWRHVEPYRLEHSRGHHYLRGYCHLRQRELLFRLDRMLAVELQAAPSAHQPQ